MSLASFFSPLFPDKPLERNFHLKSHCNSVRLSSYRIFLKGEVLPLFIKYLLVSSSYLFLLIPTFLLVVFYEFIHFLQAFKFINQKQFKIYFLNISRLQPFPIYHLLYLHRFKIRGLFILFTFKTSSFSLANLSFFPNFTDSALNCRLVFLELLK